MSFNISLSCFYVHIESDHFWPVVSFSNNNIDNNNNEHDDNDLVCEISKTCSAGVIPVRQFILKQLVDHIENRVIGNALRYGL